MYSHFLRYRIELHIIRYNYIIMYPGEVDTGHCNANCLHTSIHGIHFDLELVRPRQQTSDGIKVKNPPQQVEVHLDRVHYLNWERNRQPLDMHNKDWWWCFTFGRWWWVRVCSDRIPRKGLNLFSRSKSWRPSLERSMRRSGQMAYSSRVRLTWWILSMTVSGAGPEEKYKHNTNTR